ncbi:MAG TPA: iron ABC transporter permease [Candidatus Limnocylindria bacterium]|jgi:iron(III) transport system permease protein|nr:iron ABC transporter permease [Candidatus Limnocylindria bacterium]
MTSAPPIRRSRATLRLPGADVPIMVGASLVVTYLAVVPVATMLYASLHTGFLSPSAHWSLANYAQVFTDAQFYRLLGNTLVYGAGVALIAIVLGFGLAFLYARTDAPLRALCMVTALVPLIVPGILNTVAWLFLASPRMGLLNGIAQGLLHVRPFNAYSMPGMIFIQAMHVTPTAFIMAVATFTSMDPSLEEAAIASGASALAAFRRVTLGLARPAIVAAALLIFIQTIASFEVPQLVGIPANVAVFVSQIYGVLQAFPPDYGSAASMGSVVLVLAACGVAFANRLNGAGRHATVTGKAFRPRRMELGRWRPLAGLAILGFFAVAVVLPLAVLLWSSLLPGYETPSLSALHHVSFANYQQIWTYPLIKRSLTNSIIVSVAAGAICTALTAVVSYVTLKARVRGVWLLDVVASLPIAVPSILMGIGILFWYLVAPLPFHLYGTLALLVIGFVTIGIPYGMRYVSSGMAQIKDELEEAAAVCGASWPERFARIYLPLLMPSLLAAFLTTMIVAFREISAAIFLYSQGSEVVSIAIFDLWSNGQYPAIAALGCVMVAILFALVVIVQRLGGRLGLAAAQP